MENQEMIEMIEHVKGTVCLYINEKVNEDFRFKMFSERGALARFVTSKGINVSFASHRVVFERSIVISAKGIINGESFDFNLSSSMNNYGAGTFSVGNYGVMFSNIGSSERKAIIKPFRVILGRNTCLFAKEAFSKVSPAIKTLYSDINSIEPDELTRLSLKSATDECSNEVVDGPKLTR